MLPKPIKSNFVAPMKLLTPIILFISLVGCTSPTPNRLLGTWSRDAEKTLVALDANEKTNARQREAMTDIFSRDQTITFKKSTVSSNSTATTENGIEKNYSSRYEILGSDANSVAITSTHILSREPTITQYHFEDDDLIWCLLEGTTWKVFYQRNNNET